MAAILRKQHIEAIAAINRKLSESYVFIKASANPPTPEWLSGFHACWNEMVERQCQSLAAFVPGFDRERFLRDCRGE